MVQIETLSNGLTLIVDEMPHVQSAAYELLIPGGLVCDAADRIGASMMLAELTSRGAGGYSSRQLSDAFDEFGISHSESAGSDRFAYRGMLLSENLERALELVSLMVCEPTLNPDEIEDLRQIFLQDISSLPDSPSHWAMAELMRRYFPEPHGRPSMGSVQGFTATTIDELRALWSRLYCPKGSVLSIAGNVTLASVRAMAERYFGGWRGAGSTLPPMAAMPKPESFHINHSSAQLQMTIAFPSARFGDPDFYAAKVASVILSGGMFGRLFIEVREKRGLCYSVYARHSATKEYGIFFAYAGTTPERAHETLEVMMGEFRRLKGTVTDEELDRARANVKSSLVLGEESSGSRASSNATDWWVGGRVRSIDEILTQINGVTKGQLDSYLERFPANAFTTLTLGSRMLPGATLTAPLVIGEA